MSKLEHIVSFQELKIEKIPLKIAIFLSEEFIEKMPLSSSEPEIWPWFFKMGLKPIFKQIIYIKNFEEIKEYSEVKIIVIPELWGWFLDFSRGEENWYCSIEFKIRLLDISGKEIKSFLINGKQKGKKRINVLGITMSEVIGKFQYSIADWFDREGKEIVYFSK